MNILLIGGTSKFGKNFLEKSSIAQNNKTNIISTGLHNTCSGDYKHKILDLSSKKSINNFLDKHKNIKFNAVICAASIYGTCSTYSEALEFLSINALGYLYMLKKIHLSENSKVIFFLDAGTSQPKFGYAEYTLSKDLIKSLVKILSVERKLVTLGINMGPVISNKKGARLKDFKSKSLIKFNQPIEGLISLIDFILKEKNYFSTGTILDFSGGTYLKR